MRFRLFSFMLFLGAAACGTNPDTPPRQLVPEEFYAFAALTPDEVRYLSSQIALLNDPDRNRQRQTMDRILRFGMRAVPVLLDVLERGHASAQQGCQELLRELSRGKTRRRSNGEEVPNGPILAAWYLKELERGYNDMQSPLVFGSEPHREDTPAARRSNREVWRQQLCALYVEVAAPELTDRFLDSFVSDPCELVRASGYHACARLATSTHLPRLIDLYAQEQDLPREFLWKALKDLTGRNYPDDPKVWQAWLKRGGTQ